MNLFKSDFLKHAGTLLSGTVISQIIGFSILPILSRHYGVDPFGPFSLFASMVAVGIVFSGLRMEVGIVPEDEREDAKSLMTLSMLFNIGIGLLFTLIILLFKNQIISLFRLEENTNWLLWVPFIITITGISETLISWYNREKRYTKISGSKVVNSISTNGIKLAPIVVSLVKTNGLIIGQVVGQVLTFFMLVWKLGVNLFDQFSFQNFKRVFKKHKDLAIFSSPAALVNVLAIHMPIFLIAHFDGQTATGLFGNARLLVFVPLSYISMSVGQVFYERISRLKSDKTETSRLSHELVNLLFLIAIVPVIVTALWGHEIVPFILGSAWSDAGVYAQIMVLFFFGLYLTNPFSGAWVVYNKLKFQFIYNLTFLLITSIGMYSAYSFGFNTKSALAVFAGLGIVLRLFILNYFFILYGKSLIKKTMLACIIIAGLLALGFQFTGSFPL